MKRIAGVLFCCALVGCAAQQTEAQGPAQPTPQAQPSVAATPPDAQRAVAHLRQHIQYPASRAQVLAACANTPEFSSAEKQWFSDNLPDRTYASADDVIAALRLQTATAAPAAMAAADPPPAGPEPASYGEIRQMFGMVPSFFKMLPPNLVDASWKEFKDLWMQETSIPAKYKDLISVAVASQIPCKYCISSDSQFATFDGASDQELKEAVLMASLTRKWSTVLNGSLQDDAEFRREADKIFAHVKQAMAAKKAPPVVQVTDGKSALQDIQGTFGSVPTFLKRYPESSLAGAWLTLKQVQLNPQTAVPGKYKELIGLAVASQIPCKYCLYFHREAAKMNGATQNEIDEAVAVASDTRFWSTYMHGVQLDEQVFNREVKDVLDHMKAQMQMQMQQQQQKH
ncbi:MAG TPA: carboxymuconolactone decarboxylase family protein [Polyangiaceae bacterium]|nr:carboxymuconolactone decarboxylase family protein [Polyangiaceae bacterium]